MSGQLRASINPQPSDLHPEVLRIKILTAREPHKVLGIPPNATPEQIEHGRLVMRRAVKGARLARYNPFPWSEATFALLLETIDRAARRMPRAPRKHGGQSSLQR